MKKRLFVLLVLALAGFGLFAWWFSPTQVVQRRTGKLMETISFEEGQGRAARQTGVYVLDSLLAPDVELSSEEQEEVNGLFAKDQIEAGFNWLAGRVVESSFEVVSFEKTTLNQNLFAEVDVVVEATMRLPDRVLLDGRYSVFLVWENQESGWRLNHARWQRQEQGK